MRCYSADYVAALNNGVDTNGVLTSAATIRPSIYFFTIGTTGTPADNAVIWIWQRYTAAGTSTAVTPQALDPADPASLASAGENATVEPTYTAAAILFNLGLNARATYNWWAQDGRGMKAPATAANGLGLLPTHASSTVATAITCHFAESFLLALTLLWSLATMV